MRSVNGALNNDRCLANHHQIICKLQALLSSKKNNKDNNEEQRNMHGSNRITIITTERIAVHVI